MRVWFVIAGLVVAALLVAVVPRLAREQEPHPPRPGHVETVAAAYALVYARGVQVGDEGIACRSMTKHAARAAGCGTARVHPRACGSLRKTRIVHYDDVRATIEVGDCRIELVNSGQEWAVSKVEPRTR